MASKNISLKEETYELISKEKLPGESFSDAIERLVKGRGKLMDAVDSWEDIDEEEIKRIEKNIEKFRKNLNL
ncbi:MAG: antitoxin VapB family protein [Thermoplasmata archaeon]